MPPRPPTIRPWDVSRSTIACRIMCDVGSERGLPPDALLAGTGVHRRQLEDESAQIQFDQELALTRNLVRLSQNEPGVGLQAGLRFTLGSSGVLGFAILASRTLGEGLDVAVRYQALAPTLVHFEVSTEGDDTILTFDDSHLPAEIAPFAVERDVAAVQGVVVPLFLGHRPEGTLELSLDTVRATPFRRSAALAHLTVVTKSRRTQVRFATQLLDTPLPHADRHTQRQFVAQCAELVEQRRLTTGLATWVRTQLLSRDGQRSELDVLARRLNIHERTLRRRLAEEGTSYRRLLEETRELAAVEMLTRTDLSIDVIAHRLGYAHQANLTHAFQRWRGLTPRQFRKDLQGG